MNSACFLFTLLWNNPESVNVTSLDENRNDQIVHGWSPNWLITSLPSVVHTPMKITCHLFSDLSPQFLHEFPMLRVIRLQLCLIVDMHGQRVPAHSRGTLNSSFNGMRKRFCSCSVSPRINSALLHVRWKSEAMVEKPKRTYFSPFKCNVIMQHCQGPSDTPLEGSIPVSSFPREHINNSLLHVRWKSEAILKEAQWIHFTPLNAKCWLSLQPFVKP